MNKIAVIANFIIHQISLVNQSARLNECAIFRSNVCWIDVHWYGTRHNQRQSDYVIKNNNIGEKKSTQIL